jgi:hypothetical protein
MGLRVPELSWTASL